MRHSYFALAISGFKTGILVAAVCLQMLPFFFFMLVVAHYLGVSGAGTLVAFPITFFALVFAACWLVSKQTRHLSAWPPPGSRRTANRPVKNDDVFMKTRAERYQDLMDALRGSK